MSTADYNINNISDVSSSQEPTNTPRPSIGTLLTSNISTPTYFGSMRLYFSPEYDSCYTTKFTATLSDTNYIKFNGDNNNVDVYNEDSNKVSFNVLSKTAPSYIGLDFCSYKNNKIINSTEEKREAYQIGTVTIENVNNEWFNYKYSNNLDNEAASTNINILTTQCNDNLYNTAPQINISYDYHTFNSYIKYNYTITKNIEIQLLSPDQKNENPKFDFQSVNIKTKLDIPFGLSKDLFKDSGICRFSINGSDSIEKYTLLQTYFKYGNNAELPTDYNEFINTDIRELYLKQFPDTDISITLVPYTYYTYNWPNNSSAHINSPYSVTIKVPGVGTNPTNQPTTTKSPQKTTTIS